MASATWRSRLLKLNLALVAPEKATSRKSRPRRPRPRLSPEQLEDRTLPSGGIQLLEPAVNHAQTPPAHGPSSQGAPLPTNNGNGQGQNNPLPSPRPAAQASLVDHSSTQPPQGPALASQPPAIKGDDQGQGKPLNPQGPAMHRPLAPADNGQGEENIPPPQGSAAQVSPLPAKNGNGQGQNKTPTAQGLATEEPPSPANNDKVPGQENSLNPQGPATKGSLSPANNDQELDTSMSRQAQAEQGSLSSANNDQESGIPTSRPGQAGQGTLPPVNSDQGENNPTPFQGPTEPQPEGNQLPAPQPHGLAALRLPSPAANGQGQNNAIAEPTVNGQGNGNGQGASEQISSEAEIAQATPTKSNGASNRPASPLTPESNGPGNENSQGIDNGQAASSTPSVSPSALVSSGIRTVSAEVAQESNAVQEAVSAGAAQGASAAEAFAQSLLVDESIALGVLASEGGPVEAPSASPSRGSPPGGGGGSQVAVPDVGTESSGGGTPLLIASSSVPSGGGVSAFITKLQESPTKDDFKPSMTDLPKNDLDRLFLEWWDNDQLLFPDAMPAVDEMLFPDAMQQLDDILIPNDLSLPTESPSGEDSSLDLGRLGLVPRAAPTAVRWEDALALQARATATGEARRFVPNSQPVMAKARLESAPAVPASADEPAGDNIRPYQIALGMMPFLVAFGYTPTSLRDHVHEGQRIWKRLRGYLRRSP
jgi:hypothetical protein